MNLEQLGASFRDPSGYVFKRDGVLYRQVNRAYASNFDLLHSSGLYQSLIEKKWLVSHVEVDVALASTQSRDECHRVIRPQALPYVSYPYEWSFSQLKDAAQLTLSIQLLALQHGMILKDASAYNVQFLGSEPIFIDTLSFEAYREGTPWTAYRQFCQHFLGPLALMAFCDIRLQKLLRAYIDGVPLDLTSRMLPRRSLAKYSLLAHLHLHAKSQRQHQDDGRHEAMKQARPMSMRMQEALVASLEKAVKICSLPEFKTEWGDYYKDTNYAPESMSAKERQVMAMVDAHVDPGQQVHDLGSNTGRFSRLAAEAGHYVVSHDIDALAVERHYLLNKRKGVTNVLPLVLDLANPSPALGWAHAERDSFAQRAKSGAVLALALIHHLVISNNVPMPYLAEFLARLASTLIIEFVPKDDSQVIRLLTTREDVFESYDIESFESAFETHFEILDRQAIEGTKRTLFAMKRK